MKRGYKKKWINGLLSGKYKKTTGYLKKDDKEYCALGVLYDVTGGEWTKDEYGYWYRTDEGMASMFQDCWSRFRLKKTDATWIATLNDSMGADFYKIAQWIKENVK